MEVQIAPAGPCRKTLTIKVPPERIRSHVEEVFQAAAQQVQVKGFRPGKVPRSVLEKKLGSQILAEAKETLVNRCFEEALRDHKLSIVGRPELAGVGDQPLDESRPLEFQVHLDVRPEFELRDIKGIEVRRGSTEVTEQDVQQAIEQLAQQKRTLRSTAEPVADGDFIKVDLTFKKEDGAVVVERKGVQLNTNIPVAGTDAQAFAAQLRGTQNGAVVTLDLTFPETFEKPEVRGQKGTVTITVHDVLRVMSPTIDDEFAKGYDFESLAALREELQKRIGEEKARQEQARQENEVLDVLLNEYSFEVPATLVEDQSKHQLAAFEQRLRDQKVSDPEIQQKLAEATPESKKDAERRVRVFFLLDAIARKEKIFVTETDLEQELRNIAQQNGVTLEDARAHFEKQGMISDLRVGLMERKVRIYLREHAKITDK